MRRFALLILVTSLVACGGSGDASPGNVVADAGALPDEGPTDTNSTNPDTNGATPDVAVGDTGSPLDTGALPLEDTSAPVTDTTPPLVDTGTIADVGGLGPYPSGPYGTAVGSTLADLAMEGYLDVDPTGLATTSKYGGVKLSDVRAKSPRKYALIHVSGFT